MTKQQTASAPKQTATLDVSKKGRYRFFRVRIMEGAKITFERNFPATGAGELDARKMHAGIRNRIASNQTYSALTDWIHGNLNLETGECT